MIGEVTGIHDLARNIMKQLAQVDGRGGHDAAAPTI